jgi:putative hemolysin
MFELAIITTVIVLNGLFALSELAVVLARRQRLKVLAESGRRGARRAMALAADPGRFLSTVQIGITLSGILAGAYSGVTFGSWLTKWLVAQGLSFKMAEPLGFGIVIATITYLSLIIGELVPKQLALRSAETIACAVAPLMTHLSRVAAPALWLLGLSTKAVLKLMGRAAEPSGAVTDEEIKMLIAEAESTGVIEADEQRMIVGVLRLGDRLVRGVMTPRTEVDWIDLQADQAAARDVLIRTAHSHLPAGEGSVDTMVGVIQTREVLSAVLAGKGFDLRAHVRDAPVIPDTMDALDILSQLRQAEVPMALVHDEYGHFEGVVTPADVLEAIAGVFRSDAGGAEPHAVERGDGSWLLAGSMPADEMADVLGITLPASRDYQTVAGFVTAQLQRLPQTGESCTARGWRFEVLDLDGRRIDKVLASRAPVTSRVRL